MPHAIMSVWFGCNAPKLEQLNTGCWPSPLVIAPALSPVPLECFRISILLNKECCVSVAAIAFFHSRRSGRRAWNGQTERVRALAEQPLDDAQDVIEAQAAKIGAPLLAHGQHWHVSTERGRLVFQDEPGLRDMRDPRRAASAGPGLHTSIGRSAANAGRASSGRPKVLAKNGLRSIFLLPRSKCFHTPAT